MATFLVGAGLLLVVALVIGIMIRNKKKGKSSCCSGDCGKCGGRCR